MPFQDFIKGGTAVPIVLTQIMKQFSGYHCGCRDNAPDAKAQDHLPSLWLQARRAALCHASFIGQNNARERARGQQACRL